jgi:hypothetical protein
MIVTTSFFHNWIKSCTAKYGHTWEDINKAIDEKHIFNESSFKQCHNKIKGDIFEYICKYALLLKYDNEMRMWSGYDLQFIREERAAHATKYINKAVTHLEQINKDNPYLFELIIYKNEAFKQTIKELLYTRVGKDISLIITNYL